MDNLTVEKIQMLLFFVVPGFISLKVWGVINRNPRFHLSESLLEAVIYSSINAYFFLALFNIWRTTQVFLAYGLIFLLFPIAWAVLFSLFTKIPYLKVRLTPTAWDHFFNLREDCLIRLHMKDGSMLGGKYTTGSFASSFPEKPDLYLSELWSLDDNGIFLDRVRDTKGLLVSFEEVSFIELFELNYEGKPPVPGDPIT